MFALGALLPAIAIAWRSRRPSLASTAPFAGFVLFGLAQVIESLGGLGYGPGNDVRVNALATVHDIGLGATLVSLAGVVLGLTVGVGAAIRRRTNRPVVAVASGVAVLLVGGFAAAKLVGM